MSTASVFQKLDSAIHWVNNYLADKYLENQLRYSLDRDLPTFQTTGAWRQVQIRESKKLFLYLGKLNCSQSSIFM